MAFVMALAAVLLCLVPQVGAAQSGWKVVLTSKQAQKAAELKSEKAHTAFALSPDGPWGRAWGKNSAQAAQDIALQFCRDHLKKGRRDCFVYAVNNKVVAPSVIKTKKITAIYKPLNSRTAAAFFGRVALNYSAPLAAAKGRIEAAAANPNNLKSDAALKKALTGRTLMSTGGRSWAIWLGPKGAEQHVNANSGVLSIRFDAWRVSPDGVLCMMGGRWTTTGKPVGTKCLILGDMKQGVGGLYWAASVNTKRAVQLIAGDARRTHVK